MPEVGLIPNIANIILYAMWMLFLCYVLNRRLNLWITITGFVASYLIYTFVELSLPYASPLRMFAGIFVLLAVEFLLFRDKISRIIVAAVTVQATMFVSELIMVALFPELAEISESALVLPDETILGIYIIYLFLSALLLTLTALLINRYKNRITALEWLVYALFPVSQFMFIALWFDANMWNEGNAYNIPLQIIATVICFAADAALFYMVRSIAQRTELKAKNALLEKQIDMQKAHYAALNEQYENIRHMRHDIANHIHTIRILLENQEHEQAAAYAKELASENQFHSTLGECQNPVVDAFLYNRLEGMKGNGIAVSSSVILPTDIPIPNVTLISAFGNLLDNASEACEGQKAPELRLEARMEKGCLLISTDNTVAEDRNPAPKRTGRIPELERGIGFRILDGIAREHGGGFTAERINNRFVSTLVLNAEAVE